jgi:hypothetical protein
MYRVLRPIYTPTGETLKSRDGDDVRFFRVDFEEVGRALSMADALAKYGRRAAGMSPVLEAVKNLH